jgi:hypothetical protein
MALEFDGDLFYGDRGKTMKGIQRSGRRFYVKRKGMDDCRRDGAENS